jgi:hypothetical protein
LNEWAKGMSNHKIQIRNPDKRDIFFDG